MNSQDFRISAHKMVDWMADYLKDIEKYPVKSQVSPGEIYSQIPDKAPQKEQSFESIFSDFEKIILPGMTHWQHPNFHAYFNGNSSYPSVLAEMLTATLAAQCMLWETSPAAAELEEKMMDWLKDLLHLPSHWQGVIQDSASTATLVSLLSAREQKYNWEINTKGFSGKEKFRVYCSQQAHSSIEKAVRIAGFGSDNLIKIGVDDNYAISTDLLKKQINKDVAEGFSPLCLVATLGTTGSTAVDPLPSMGAVCREYKLWLHVDAAWAGTALMLPECKDLRNGLEMADSFVFNPHKWMFTNFDCTAYFVKDAEVLKRTFTLIPEYLKTKSTGVNNYSDWGIQLGRRFRALKLWFVLRSFGKEGLREKVRKHIGWARELGQKIDSHEDFELLAAAPLATVCFRYRPADLNDQLVINQLNEKLLEKLNDSGKLYLTHTRLSNNYTLRIVVGQTYQRKEHIDRAWLLIQKTAETVTPGSGS